MSPNQAFSFRYATKSVGQQFASPTSRRTGSLQRSPRAPRRRNGAALLNMLKMDVDDFKEEVKKRWEEKAEESFKSSSLDFWEPYKEGCSLDEFQFTYEHAPRVFKLIKDIEAKVGRKTPVRPVVEASSVDLVLLRMSQDAGFRDFFLDDAATLAKMAWDCLEPNAKWRAIREMTAANARKLYGMPYFEGIEEIFGTDEAQSIDNNLRKANAHFEKKPDDRDELQWFTKLSFPEQLRMNVSVSLEASADPQRILEITTFVRDNCKLMDVHGISVASDVPDVGKIVETRQRVCEILNFTDERSLQTSVLLREEHLAPNTENTAFLEDLMALPGTLLLRVPTRSLFSKNRQRNLNFMDVLI